MFGLFNLHLWVIFNTNNGWFEPQTLQKGEQTKSIFRLPGYNSNQLGKFWKNALPETNETLAPEKNGIPQKNYIVFQASIILRQSMYGVYIPTFTSWTTQLCW